MNELVEIESKGLVDVKVFQVCECDAVAAYSLEDAKEWYKNETGLSDDELYSDDEVKFVPLDHLIYESEYSEKRVPIRKVVNEQWNGVPFIVFTTV